MDSNSPQTNEKPSVEALSNTECRLRKVLNEDCILKVLENLNVLDLIQMCHVDVYFENLITQWIIGKKLVDLQEMDQSLKDYIFQTFGKSMTKFIDCDVEFNDFLENVTRHCKQGKLTEVQLNYVRQSEEDDLNNIRLSTPCFSNLHTLKLHSLIFDSYGAFLETIALASSKLHYLELSHVDIKGTWLKTEQMKNLCDLRIHQPKTVSMADVTILLHSSPKLETLTFTGIQDITAIGTTLAECCPDLKRFEDVHTTNPVQHFTLGRKDRYNFLASFDNLKTLTLTSYTLCGCDLYDPLVKLATKNIEILRVIFDMRRAVTYNGTNRASIMQSSFANFLSLQVLEVEIRNYKSAGSLHCDFILYLARQSKNLAKFTIESEQMAFFNMVMKSLPQTRTFSMSKMKFDLPVEMRRMVYTLRTIRKDSGVEDGTNKIQLIVSMEQWQELKRYKDIDRLCDMVIDRSIETISYMTPYHVLADLLCTF